MRLFAAALCCLFAGASVAAQEPLQVRAAVDMDRVFVGQKFLYQIHVEGSDSPSQPDLSQVKTDFIVERAGGGPSNSQSISIVNGQMTRVVQKGYNFRFRLTPKREGLLTIPAVTIEADGRVARTNAVRIAVRPPEEIDDFKLRLTLSEERAVVGQPVVLTTAWYVGGSVDQFSMRLPVLEDERFEIADPQILPSSSSQAEYLDLPVGDRIVTAKKQRATLDGREFLTVSFDKVLAAKEPGVYRLPAAVVSFRTVRSVSRGPRSLFDDFFGESLFSRRQAFETFAIPSNEPTLEVRELPSAGRPANFSGLIGRFRFTASAKPEKVQVGEPITLTIRVSGPPYLDYVRLPDLSLQEALRQEFQIPEEMGPGELEPDAKVFTQTIRAKNPDVEAVPSLAWNYYDPAEGTYAVARTEPIPLEVEDARVLTATDAEGATAEEIQSELQRREAGIAHNYQDASALVSQPANPLSRALTPGWAAALVAPPLGFLAVWSWLAFARRREAAASLRSRQALRNLERSLQNLDPESKDFHERLLGDVSSYLAAKLERRPGTLTFVEVRNLLENGGVRSEAIDQLQEIFLAGEASRYAGAAGQHSRKDWIGQARTACEAVEASYRP